jgi:hypothetical protein
VSGLPSLVPWEIQPPDQIRVLAGAFTASATVMPSVVHHAFTVVLSPFTLWFHQVVTRQFAEEPDVQPPIGQCGRGVTFPLDQ